METNCGLKVSDRKIKDSGSHCLSVSLRIPVGQAHCWVSEPSHRKKVALFQHEWVASKRVRACMCDIVCVAFVLAPQCDFLTVMMSGLHKLTDGEGENGNKNGRQGKSKMRATETEREKKSHSEAIVDNSSRFFSLSG